MSLKFSSLLLCGEVRNGSRFRIGNSANKPGSQGSVAQRCDSPISSGRSVLGREFGARLCEQFIDQLRLLEHDQTIRDSGDVCGARNTQFEQEFLGLFRAETVSAYDWRDHIGDFCVADYLTELNKVHPMGYSTRFSLHLSRTSSCLAVLSLVGPAICLMRLA